MAMISKFTWRATVFKQDVNLVLKPEDDKVYAIVKSIFAKQRDLKDDTFTPGGPTGTWTSITLVDQEGEKTTTKNIRPQGELGLIYNFVKTAAKEPPPSDYNDGPEPSSPPVSDSKSKKLPWAFARCQADSLGTSRKLTNCFRVERGCNSREGSIARKFVPGIEKREYIEAP